MLQQVHVPADVGEAVALLAGDPASALLSGGTLLMPVLNNEATSIRSLVSIRRLPLAQVTIDGNHARVGAATTLSDVTRDQRLAFLSSVIESMASPLIRNLATVGGNLFAPQPYGDLAVALLALDASVDVVGPGGERQVPLAQLLERGVAHGDIVTAVEFIIPAQGTWFSTKAMRRKLNSASIVTVAAVIEVVDAAVSQAWIALGGVGLRPLRASSVEAALLGQPLTPESVTAAAALAVQDAEPFSDAYASAWYRARVLPVHIRRALLREV